MRVELLRTPAVASLKAVLDTMDADPDVASILVLACAANGHESASMNPVLQGCAKPVFGGIFPQIVVDRDRIEQGLIVAGLACSVRIHTLGLETASGTLEAQLASLFGDEELRGATMFVLVDGLSQGIARLVEALFNTVGLGPSYIGGGAGSLSFQQAPCLFTNQGMVQDAAILALADCPSSVGVAHG